MIDRSNSPLYVTQEPREKQIESALITLWNEIYQHFKLYETWLELSHRQESYTVEELSAKLPQNLRYAFDKAYYAMHLPKTPPPTSTNNSQTTQPGKNQ